MFFATYKATLKTLLRAALLWMVAALVLGVVIECGLRIGHSRTLVENGKIVGHVMDNEPEFREYMDHNFYVQTVMNSQYAWLMPYAMPAFAVLSTMLVLSRDHKDNFFEIEKSSGVKTSSYFFGRFAALLTVNSAVCLIAGFTGLHTYFFSRGGPPDFFSSLWEYLSESTVRVLRVFCCAQLLTILFFIGITYMIGSLLRSGFAGGVIGFAHVLLTYGAGTFFRMRLPEYYLNYLTPRSMNHYIYWGLYNSELFDVTHLTIGNPFSVTDVLICTGYLLGVSLLFFTVSFICTKRRSI